MTIGRAIAPPRLVNTSLERFAASVKAVISRFPFYGLETRVKGDFAAWEADGNELAAMLHRVDPSALADPDGFWQTFVDDVKNGDYPTEYVVE
jgi:hypothetical protein